MVCVNTVHFCLPLDPNTRTLEENFTPLHFAARYTPRIIDREVQLQETRADHAVEVGKLSTSGRVMQFLVNLRKERRVKASWSNQYFAKTFFYHIVGGRRCEGGGGALVLVVVVVVAFLSATTLKVV